MRKDSSLFVIKKNTKKLEESLGTERCEKYTLHIKNNYNNYYCYYISNSKSLSSKNQSSGFLGMRSDLLVCIGLQFLLYTNIMPLFYVCYSMYSRLEINI